MRRSFAACALIATMAAVSFSAAGVEVTGLYEAQVPVTGQDATERDAASRAALEEVLVKVTGSNDVLEKPEIKSLLDEAEQWVQRYQYRAAPPPSSPPPSQSPPIPPTMPGTVPPAAVDQSATPPPEPTAVSPPAAPSQILWMAFDREAINQRLSEAGLPVWSMNRPRTLMWLAVEEGGDRYLVGGDNRPDLQQMVNDQAERRGLPLSVPLMDLQDQGSLTVADVWGDFSDVIFRASDRYQADGVLVGRVYTVAPDQWQSHWTLYHRGAATTWESAVGSEDDAISAGVAGATEQYAKRYALMLTPNVADSVTLTIENVASLNDYARALRYLQSLDPVAGVQIVRVDGDAISYRLKVRGEPQGVIRSIGWGKTLITAGQAGAEMPDGQGTDNKEEGTPAGGEYRYRIVP